MKAKAQRVFHRIFASFENLFYPYPDDISQVPPTVRAALRHYSKGSEKYLLRIAIFAAIVAAGEAWLFSFLGHLVDWLTTRSPDTFIREELLMLTCISLLVVIILPTASLLGNLSIYQTIMGNYPMRIRWNSHRALLRQSLTFFSEEFAGRISTKVMQTALAARDVVIKLVDVATFNLVFIFSTLLVTTSIDYRLALPLLMWIISYAIILKKYIPKLKEASSRQADARSNMTGKMVDSYTNILTVKLFSHTVSEEKYAKEGMQKFLDTVYVQMRLVSLMYLSVRIANCLLIFATGAVGIYLWRIGVLEAGAIATSESLVLRISGLAYWIMWETSSFFENIGIVRDGINTLSKVSHIKDKVNATQLEISQGAISFNNVSFHYGKGSGIINQFSLHIAPGEKVGIVGRSGAGKSTLMNLLLRFYDVESGSITIDNQNVNEVTQESLRSQIGVVTQDTSLLHRSIRDNILFGRPDATDDEMIEAARQAMADEFITHLRDSHGRTAYDAFVGERGVKLSGGQRQRIAIARVLLKNAPILVLDEATSALDSEVEAAIQSNLIKLMQGKTVLAIAHRLSTIAAMDRLIVLDQGQIIEDGTHQELLERNNLYKQLWDRQSGGFIYSEEEVIQ